MRRRPLLTSLGVVIGFVATVALVSLISLIQSSTGLNGAPTARTLIISSDLPLQGASNDASAATNNAIRLYLEQRGNKIGDHTIKFQEYDNSTPAKGQWDAAQCTKNATDHVKNKDEVAIMGTFNSRCSKIQLPHLNQDLSGPVLMVSHANTYPGLTKTWDLGEPEKFFPSGKRSYARVITTDDYQGAAAAQFAAQDLKVSKCYVLNDGQDYGRGVAKGFADEAAKQNIQVLGNEAWDAKATGYKSLFGKIKSVGADCVYLGGNYGRNDGQVVKDKVAVLGANDGAVKLIAPGGYIDYPDFRKLAEAEGTYLMFAGPTMQQPRHAWGAGAELLDAYKAKYGSDPSTSDALYGVAAVQVILAAIAKSDGTRKGVRDAVFESDGITIPTADSVLGEEIKIDPKTGDVQSTGIDVKLMKGGVETFVKTQPVVSRR